MTTAPVIVAPAMNCEMWAKPAVQRNVSQLVRDGYHIVGPEEGWLSCGQVGAGRMADPGSSCERMEAVLHWRNDHMKILITAGPTREYIDDVRFLSNASSGRMGYSLVTAAIQAGHEVVLVTGPVEQAPPEGCEVHRIETTDELRQRCLELFPLLRWCDRHRSRLRLPAQSTHHRQDHKNRSADGSGTCGNIRRPCGTWQPERTSLDCWFCIGVARSSQQRDAKTSWRAR